LQITTVSKKSPPAALIATDGLFHCHHVTIMKGTMTKHPRHLQHSTGQRDTELFSDIWENLDRFGQCLLLHPKQASLKLSEWLQKAFCWSDGYLFMEGLKGGRMKPQ